jgi:ribonuclease E
VQADVVASILTQDAIAEEAAIEPPTAEPEKPKRARRRKVADAPMAEASQVAEAVVEDVTPEARPKTRGRRGQVKAPAPTSAEAMESAEAISDVSAPSAAVAAPTTPADGFAERAEEPAMAEQVTGDGAESKPEGTRRRKELPPDEIIVSSTAAPEGEAKPKRAGWWQRGFFGN